MGGSGPMAGMFLGFMPLIRQKLGEVDEETLVQLTSIMSEAFKRVGDSNISEKDFEDWLKFE